MITIKLFYQENILVGIESSGHSGFAEKGYDIVCAAVSVLMQSLVLGLREIAKVESLICQVNDSVPLISVRWIKKSVPKISLLTETISESLKQIAEQNSDYVKICSKGVNE